MFRAVREKAFKNPKLLFTVIPFIAILIVFLNSNTLKSSFVGMFALVIYLIVNGEIFGRVFFREEKRFFRVVIGSFAFIIILALAEIAAVFAYSSDLWYLLGLIFAALFCSFLNLLFVKYETRSVEEELKRKIKNFGLSSRHILLGAYAILLVWAFWILMSVRSGWVRGPIWNVIPPEFLYVYFAATVVLLGIVLLPGKAHTRLLMLAVHSTFSLSFIIIVSYPGIIFYDPWYDLGRARVILPTVNLVKQLWPFGSTEPFWVAAGDLTFVRLLNMFLRGVTEHVLIASFAAVLNLDMYWTYAFLLPVLWGFFVPMISYRISETIGLSKNTSVLTAVLTIPNLHFLAWGKLTEATSLGVFFFFLFFYLLVLSITSGKTRKTYFLIFVVLGALFATHFVAALVALSLLILTFAFEEYNRLKSKSSWLGSVSLSLAFIASMVLIPSLVIVRGIILPMIGTSAFSADKLLETSVWTLVFGMSEELPVFNAMFYEIFPVLGFIGLVYALRNRTDLNRKLCLFFLLTFVGSLVQYRILKYAVVGGLFSPARLQVFIDILGLPFVALTVSSAMLSLLNVRSKTKWSFRLRRFLATILICVSLSAWIMTSVYVTYEYYTAGLMPTSLEVQAIKYIEEHAGSRYVVLAQTATTVMSWGYIGIPNPDKWYFVIGGGGQSMNPSVSEMYESMQKVGVDVGYFIVSSFRGGDFDEIVAEASRVFGFLKDFSDENGNRISIFYYKIPPLPTSPDVTAFYWETPPAYYIQNALMRVVINPETQTLDLVDFWGDLYESVELQKTLVDGNSIGNLTSIGYFDLMNNEWVEWEPQTSIPSASEFQFKLDFENDALFGIVESESPLVKLWWASGQSSTLSLKTGDFSRIYIPGLVGGIDSYDVNSRKYGFLYTNIMGTNMMFQPAYNTDINSTFLTYTEILNYCGFNRTQGYFSYDLYVQNLEDEPQWAYVEVWFPDEVYTGSFPPLRYSPDSGQLWLNPVYDVEAGGSQAIKTLGGVDVNWVFSTPKSLKEKPAKWWSFEKDAGGSPVLPDAFTDSGGAQNRMIFGFFLPAKDKILVRLGSSTWYVSPLKLSYVFTDSDDSTHGLLNMNRSLVTLYNVGVTEYVGGFRTSQKPTSLVVVEDENGKINSLIFALPPETIISLLGQKEVDTTSDSDADGIPDRIEYGPE